MGPDQDQEEVDRIRSPRDYLAGLLDLPFGDAGRPTADDRAYLLSLANPKTLLYDVVSGDPHGVMLPYDQWSLANCLDQAIFHGITVASGETLRDWDKRAGRGIIRRTTGENEEVVPLRAALIDLQALRRLSEADALDAVFEIDPRPWIVDTVKEGILTGSDAALRDWYRSNTHRLEDWPTRYGEAPVDARLIRNMARRRRTGGPADYYLLAVWVALCVAVDVLVGRRSTGDLIMLVETPEAVGLVASVGLAYRTPGTICGC